MRDREIDVADIGQIGLNGHLVSLFFRRPMKLVIVSQLHPSEQNNLVRMPYKVMTGVHDGMHQRHIKSLNRDVPCKLLVA